MAQEKLTVLEDFPPVNYDQWRAEVEKDLKGAPFDRKLVTRTYEQVNVQPVYTAADAPATEAATGLPGAFPFTRGSSALGTAVDGWLIRQVHGESSLEATNAAILADLRAGVTSIQLRADEATRRGLDPAAAAAEGLVGKEGAPLASQADLAAALRNVDLSAAPVELDAGVSAPATAAHLLALSGGKLAPHTLLGLDPIGALAAYGSLPCSASEALEDAAKLAVHVAAAAPGTRTFRVGSEVYHAAGAHAAQDLALALATGTAYLRAMADAGLDLTVAAQQLEFSFAVGTRQFTAIAKLRAARHIWARVLEACGVTAPETALRLHVSAGRRVLTARDPWVNMLRGTVTTFAGAVAGAQVISAPAFDVAIGTPDAFSRRIARNTQVILQEESHLHRVVDPAGGSWFIEKLTSELAEAAWKLFQAIEAEGGILTALENGWVGKQLGATLSERQKSVATRKDPITGVSEFPNIDEKPPVKAPVDLVALRTAVVARIPQGTVAADATWAQRIAAAPTVSTSKLLRSSAQATCVAPLVAHPNAEAFEALRDACDAHREATGERPLVFLANLGPVAHHTARATYAKNFFEAGGLRTIGNAGFRDAESAAAAFRESGAKVAVLCSSDKLYQEGMVASVAPALKAAGARTVILAGAPGDFEAAFREAGVDRFIFVRCNVLETLRVLLQEEGVLS